MHYRSKLSLSETCSEGREGAGRLECLLLHMEEKRQQEDEERNGAVPAACSEKGTRETVNGRKGA